MLQSSSYGLDFSNWSLNIRENQQHVIHIRSRVVEPLGCCHICPTTYVWIGHLEPLQNQALTLSRNKKDYLPTHTKYAAENNRVFLRPNNRTRELPIELPPLPPPCLTSKTSPSPGYPINSTANRNITLHYQLKIQDDSTPTAPSASSLASHPDTSPKIAK
jgi:hypothetical protein